MNTKKWKTADGRKLRIKDMDTNHIWNTVNVLIRSAILTKIRTEQAYLYPAFGGPQGDMAQLAFESEMDQCFQADLEDYLHPIYEDMVEELKRRNCVPPKFPSEDAVEAIVLGEHVRTHKKLQRCNEEERNHIRAYRGAFGEHGQG